jgi:hypothetical protein
MVYLPVAGPRKCWKITRFDMSGLPLLGYKRLHRTRPSHNF